MTKWEYHVEQIMTLQGRDHSDAANALGREGWELVGVTAATEEAFPLLYFKRPAPESMQKPEEQ